MNLAELCGHLRNWFVRSDNDKHAGAYSIVGGSVSLPWLADGQYFRVIGSVFNDGVWQYPAANLVDEEFNGEIWAMAVPPDVVSLSDEITAWEEKYRDAVQSPYTSESFGGYSYAKTVSTEDGAENSVSWITVFKSRLNRWRKL